MSTSGIIDKLNAGNGPKPYSHAWKYVEEFDLVQAAHLWCGCEPKTFYTQIAGDDPPPELQAYFTMLEAAERSGELKTDRPQGPNAWMAGPFTTPSKATRTDLEAFAKSKSLYPDFLFGPMHSTGEENATEFTEGPDFADKGRKYNWNAIAAVPAFLEMEGKLPEDFMDICRATQAFVEENLSDFAEAGAKRGPDLSQYQKCIGGMVRELMAIRKRKYDR